MDNVLLVLAIAFLFGGLIHLVPWFNNLLLFVYHSNGCFVSIFMFLKPFFSIYVNGQNSIHSDFISFQI